MIIRSQDKYSMIDNLNLRIVKRRPPTEYDYIGEDIYTETGIFLGHYSTEEKAIKVLDMIQKAYSKANYYFISNGFVQNVVFEMPQDSEV